MAEEQQAAEALIAEEIKTQAEFDPSRYLVNLNGRGEYLEVKWRLMWLRTEHPDAILETECVYHDPQGREACFKCRVTLPSGGVATGWGTEQAGDFRDYYEKAETKSIGRALAALGYGTQFAQDHDYGGPTIATKFANNQHAIVDAPVTRPAPRNDQRRSDNQIQTRTIFANQRTSYTAQEAQQQGGQLATERQVKFIRSLAREAGLDEQELAAWTTELYQKDLDQLDRREASALIEAIQRRRTEIA